MPVAGLTQIEQNFSKLATRQRPPHWHLPFLVLQPPGKNILQVVPVAGLAQFEHVFTTRQLPPHWHLPFPVLQVVPVAGLEPARRF